MTRQHLKMLKELELQHLRLKHPSVPDHCIPTTAWSDKTANGLTKAVVAFLNYSGHYAERINTMGVYRAEKKQQDQFGKVRTIGSGKWTPGGSTKGSADISSTIQVKIAEHKVGVSVKWEVKIGKDRQSDDQKIYEQRTVAAGGRYYIIRDFEDFYKKYTFFLSEYS